MRVSKQTIFLIFVSAFIFFFSSEVFAQSINQNNALDQIVDQFKSVSSEWVGPLIKIATKVFWSLVLIDWTLAFGMLALKGGSFEDFSAAFLQRILFVTFGAWVLLNPGYLADLVTGFRDSANIATGVSSFSPSDIFDSGIKLVSKIWSAFSIWDGDSWGLALVSVIILVCISITAAWLVLTLVEMYIVMFGGVILLGFFGSNFTKEYAMRYFGYLFSVGMKLFVITLISGLGIELLESWTNNLENNSASFLVMTGVAIVIAALIVQLPNLIQGFVAGVSGINGIQAAATAASIGGSAGGSVTAAAKGMAGAAMSISEASKLASSQGHTGIAKAGATISNLAQAGSSDMQGKLGGDISRQHGSAGSRMAGEMKALRLGESGSESKNKENDTNKNSNENTPQGSSGGENNGATGSIMSASSVADASEGLSDDVGSQEGGGAAEALAGESNGQYVSSAPSEASNYKSSVDESGSSFGSEEKVLTASGASKESQVVTGSSQAIENDTVNQNKDDQLKTDQSSQTVERMSSPTKIDQSSDDIARMKNGQLRNLVKNLKDKSK